VQISVLVGTIFEDSKVPLSKWLLAVHSHLKRSIDGTHHSVSEKHLPRYLGEFDYRYNTRKMLDGERTEQTIQQTAGKRLRYKEPVKP
jgi:uncharacterized protein YqjF (DUF2071 family)